jgi:uncharacterized cupredoxin-like copper-binding protein
MMMTTRRTLTAVLAAVALAAGIATASAATVVNVQLTDKPNVEMATGIFYGQPGVDMTKATMALKPTRTSAPAGEVTFHVTNMSTDMIHEMVVVRLDDPTAPLPYDPQTKLLNEDAMPDLGEVSELDPKKSGTLTVDMKPGTYLLVCNQPGHYEAGMWAVFTVTK